MPVAKEKLVTLKKNAEPYVQMVSEESEEVYRTPNDFIRHHLVNAQKAADPYFQVPQCSVPPRCSKGCEDRGCGVKRLEPCSDRLM
ncbi:unnamed protein product [Urochloa humidicola]